MYIVHHNPANLAARSINTYVYVYVYLTNQRTEFHQSTADDVAEDTDELNKILKVEGSTSRSQRQGLFPY